MKAYKKTLSVTMLIILLPCLIGLLLWNRLPDRIPTHWGYNYQIDGYSSKLFVVFGLPAMMAALQFFCFFVTVNDPKRANISRKLVTFILSIIPALSLFVALLSYGVALGYPINPGVLTNLLLGFLFIVIGNYLPKVKQNYTMGIKIPWTLNSETNWYKTHRLAGWIWTFGGIVFLINAVFQSQIFFIAAIILMTGIPTVYSYLLYKKGIRN